MELPRICSTPNRPKVVRVKRTQDQQHNCGSAVSSSRLRSSSPQLFNKERRTRVSPDVQGVGEKIHKPPEKRNNQKKKSYRLACILITATIGLLLLVAGVVGVVFAIKLAKATDTTTTTSSATSSPTTSVSFCWNSTGTTVAGTSDVAGTASTRLDRPFGLAFDSSNTLYISDQNNNRVQKWIIGASSGTTAAGQASGTLGTTSNSFDTPSGILLDSSGNMYVADTNNNRVQFYSAGSTTATTIAGILGSTGTANNELANPFGLARDSSSGTLFISDQSNHRVMSYVAGASSGTVVAGGNGQGTSSTQLNYPVGIYFEASSNSLIIANTGANNIVRWTLGATSWTLVVGSASGSSGSASTLLNYPVGVISDSTGNVYVADRDNHRIQFFLSGQSTGRTIAGVTNTQGNSSTLLYNPYSMLLDAQLNLYVADTYNHRIQRFLRC